MDLMLVEPHSAGHRVILYVRSIVREAVARGWRVRLLTSSRSLDDSGYRTVAEEFGSALETYTMPDVGTPEGGALALLRYQWRQYDAIREGYRAACASNGVPDVVHLNSGDVFGKALALRGSPVGSQPFSVMLVAPRFHHRGQGVSTPPRWIDGVDAALFRRLLRTPTLALVMGIDPTLAAAAEQGGWPGAGKVRWVPDPGSLRHREVRGGARARLGIPPDAFVILLYGEITARKGIDRLLEAVRRPEVPTETVALVAGLPDADGERALSGRDAQRLRAQGRLHEVRVFLDDEAEGRVFSAADAVWLGYEGFYGSSGVLVQAGAAGVPVLASPEGLIGWLTRGAGSGVLLEGGAAGAARALARLVSDPPLREALGKRGRELARRNTPEGFGTAVCDALREAAP